MNGQKDGLIKVNLPEMDHGIDGQKEIDRWETLYNNRNCAILLFPNAVN